MARQLIDGGGWFSTKKAEFWEEDSWWDGHNYVSRATGDAHSHQRLYRTAKGAWVLHSWSQWQGSCETWERIEPEAARDWLLSQSEGDAAEQYFPGCLAETEI